MRELGITETWSNFLFLRSPKRQRVGGCRDPPVIRGGLYISLLQIHLGYGTRIFQKIFRLD